MISLIVIANKCGGISTRLNSLPFKNKWDMKHFKELTMGGVVIMGRKTFETLPQLQPLKDRVNIVISRNGMDFLDNNPLFKALGYKPIDYIINPNFECVFDIEHCLMRIKNHYSDRKVFLIGGASIYNQFLERNLVSKIHYTKMNVNQEYDNHINFTTDNVSENYLGNVSENYLGNVPENWRETRDYSDETIGYKNRMETIPGCQYKEYNYFNREEYQFLNTMDRILKEGEITENRTGVKTHTLFSPGELSFNLRDSFPLLTTRTLPLKHIYEELMWFLSGKTNVQILRDKGVHVWDGNTNKDFLLGRGLPYEEWDIGPSYPFQFRHWGEEYKGFDKEYAGFDQLAEVIRQLKEEQQSRRIIINLWNPAQVDQMSLPPCGFCYQFHVSAPKSPSGKGRLTTKVMQRSSDIALAGGWNIASAALFTYLLSSVCGLEPERLIWSPGNTHIYENQVDAVKEQLSRECNRPFPKLFMLCNKKNIMDFKFHDFKLLNYNPHGKISIKMTA